MSVHINAKKAEVAESVLMPEIHYVQELLNII